MKKNISIIIPIYNEESSIESLYNEIKNVLDNNFNKYEIIFIDDGSHDSSFNIINNISYNDLNIIAIRLNRNYGKSDALNEGFKVAKYDYIATLDGDLQDDPNEILKLVTTLDEGWDCVSGWKKNRKDPENVRKFETSLKNFEISQNIQKIFENLENSRNLWKSQEIATF